MRWIESLPVAGSGVIVIGGFLLLTVLIGLIIEKAVPHHIRKEHNDLAGFILAVIGVVYAVLLAFVVVSVWARFDQAESRSYEEASSLAVVYRDVDVFPRATVVVRAALRTYVKLVIREEWPAMARGAQSDEADVLLEKIDRVVRSLPVTSQTQADAHQQMLEALDASFGDRDTRLAMDATGIDPVMWFVLIAGAVVTVCFTFLFGFQQGMIRWVMTGSLAALIGLVLFLTVAMDFPFRGGVVIEPGAFLRVLDTFHSIGP